MEINLRAEDNMILNIIMSNRDNDDTSSTMTMTYDWYKVRDIY